MAKVLNDVDFLSEAMTPIDPFDIAEVGTHDGSGGVHDF